MTPRGPPAAPQLRGWPGRWRAGALAAGAAGVRRLTGIVLPRVERVVPRKRAGAGRSWQLYIDQCPKRSAEPVFRSPPIVVGLGIRFFWSTPVLIETFVEAAPPRRAMQSGCWTRCPALRGDLAFSRPGWRCRRRCGAARARSGRARAPRQRCRFGPTGCRCGACRGWRSLRGRWLQHQGVPTAGYIRAAPGRPNDYSLAVTVRSSRYRGPTTGRSTREPGRRRRVWLGQPHGHTGFTERLRWRAVMDRSGRESSRGPQRGIRLIAKFQKGPYSLCCFRSSSSTRRSRPCRRRGRGWSW